ncbi:MAG: hypothetical protein E6959_10220, partial [Eikenella corrodens]|nr:hypothetical protein [Eikenella corrodens]
ALFVGTGKAEELAAEVQAHNIELAVFNHELTPTSNTRSGRLRDLSGWNGGRRGMASGGMD